MGVVKHLLTGMLISPILFGVAVASTTGKSPPTFADVNRIFSRNCVACHNAITASGSGDLNLQSEVSFAAIVGRKASEVPIMLVKPGKPDQSYLYAKLIGTHGKVGGSGEMMPLGQGKLSSEKLDIIRRWIEGGARR